MTKCLTPQEIEAFYDGDLPPDIQLDMADHVTTCENCRKALDELQQIERQLCEAHSAIEIHESWLAQTREMINATAPTASVEPAQPLSSDRQRSSSPSRYLLWAATAASLLLLLTIVARHASHLRSVAVQTPQVDATTDDQASNTSTASTDSILDDIPANSSATNTATMPDKNLEWDELPTAPTVRAHGDFLVAKHPAADDEFEFYFVLPIRK